MNIQSENMSYIGGVSLTVSWIGGIMSIDLTHIPIVLSSIASLLAIVSYMVKINNDVKNKK